MEPRFIEVLVEILHTTCSNINDNKTINGMLVAIKYSFWQW